MWNRTPKKYDNVSVILEKFALVYATIRTKDATDKSGGETPFASRDGRPSGGAPTLSADRPARVRGECTRPVPRGSPIAGPDHLISLTSHL
ncbi:unnamed protein product [Leptosia nina]|uniref:Uncharacterized protein n=1 Tax=Leptosia nina TaxID=320188 RepID=A0AAV1JIF1_9NEOP